MGGHRDQRLRLQAVVGQACSCGNQGGEGHWQVHHPWLVHAEAQEQAGDEGWQEGSLRQGGHGKGEASIQSCEGLLCGSVEEEHLSRQPTQVLEWTFHSRVFRERLGVSVRRVHRSLLIARGKKIRLSSKTDNGLDTCMQSA